MEKVKSKIKNLFRKFDRKCDDLHHKKSGMELLQLAIVVVISVGLIGVVAILASSIGNQIETASSQVGGTWSYQKGGGADQGWQPANGENKTN